jgi:hypothetical protein
MMNRSRDSYWQRDDHPGEARTEAWVLIWRGQKIATGDFIRHSKTPHPKDKRFAQLCNPDV